MRLFVFCEFQRQRALGASFSADISWLLIAPAGQQLACWHVALSRRGKVAVANYLLMLELT